MNLPKRLSLESLLFEFGIDKDRAEELAESVKELAGGVYHKKDIVLRELEDFALECSKKYAEFFWERNGREVTTHYGWLNVALGNSYLSFGKILPEKSERPYHYFYEAWSIFSSSLVNRADIAHRLVTEFPKLLQFINVVDYYKRHPKLVKMSPEILDASREVADYFRAHPEIARKHKMILPN